MDYNITYREKDKGWQVIVSYKSDRKWKQKSKQGFKTKKEAKAASELIIEELKNNQDLNVDFKGITFGQFMIMHMDHLKIHTQENTLKVYKRAHKHFNSLDNIEIAKITSLHIQNIFDSMIKKGLSYGTINTYKIVIKAAFNSAKNTYNIISKSPVDKVVIKLSKEPSKKKALTESQLKDLLDKTKNLKHKVIFSLAGMCGMRIGEILGFQWNKIDFKNNLITVDSQWKFLNDNKVGLGQLKSNNSYRIIPLPPSVKTLLIEWKNNEPLDISNRVLVYRSYLGANCALNRSLKRIGYNISIHELRHTYATTLISRGVDFKTVAKLLGHDIEMTMKTYSHVTDDMFNNATKVLSKIF